MLTSDRSKLSMGTYNGQACQRMHSRMEIKVLHHLHLWTALQHARLGHLHGACLCNKLGKVCMDDTLDKMACMRSFQILQNVHVQKVQVTMLSHARTAMISEL